MASQRNQDIHAVIVVNQRLLDTLSRQYAGEKPENDDIEQAREGLTRLRAEFPDFDITPLVVDE